MWEGVGSQDHFLLAEGIQRSKRILGPDPSGVVEKQGTEGGQPPAGRELHAEAILGSVYVCDLRPAM